MKLTQDAPPKKAKAAGADLTGKTIVVFNARPKMKTRPVIVPAKPGAGGAVAAARLSQVELDEEDDEDEDDDE